MERQPKNISDSETRKTRAAGESLGTPDIPHAPGQPLWEIIVEIGTQIPQQEWTKVPEDASINYKHYLYGAPKKKV